MQCPECGYENRNGMLFCEDCGSVLFDQDAIPTKKLAGSRHRPRDPQAQLTVILQVNEETALLQLPAARVIIGRYDANTMESGPDLDLAPYGAGDKGVSRLHVALDARQNPPTLMDMGSANGTFVNGQKLTPDQPCFIKDGDEIRLGRLKTRVRFEYVPLAAH